MSGTPTPPVSADTFDPLACAACGDPFTAVNPGGVPTTLSCGHTVCAACVAAIAVVTTVTCPICQAVISDDGVKNALLGEFCDALRSADQNAADAHTSGIAGALESAKIPEIVLEEQIDAEVVKVKGPRRKKAKVEADGAGAAAASSDFQGLPHRMPGCRAHPDVPICAYCTLDAEFMCGRCANGSHKGKTHRVVGLSTAAGIAALQSAMAADATRYNTMADACDATATAVPDARARLLANADAAISAVIDGIAQAKARLDDVSKRMIHEIKAARDRRVKSLGVYADELAVTASQLRLGARLARESTAWPGSGVASAYTAMQAFSTLSDSKLRDPLDEAHVHARVCVDGIAAMAAFYTEVRLTEVGVCP